MVDYFQIFVYAIQSNDNIVGLVDNILAGIGIQVVDSYLNEGNQSCIAIRSVNETTSIDEQGFQDEYRIKVAFEYDIDICSKKGDSESFCRSIAENVITFLQSDISVEYDEIDYDFYIESIGTNPDFKAEVNFWIIPLRIKGYSWTKYI